MRFIEHVSGLECRCQLDLYNVGSQYFLLDALPIDVARIPVKGSAPDKCVYVHARYIPRGFAHRKCRLKGRIRGRCIEFLVGNEETGGVCMLSVKGTGANADEELVINPKQWWGRANGGSFSWHAPGIVRNSIDNTGRQWGAVH